MRRAFVEALLESAERDERIWLLCGDLGYSILEPFARRFPQRFVNTGIAEQNMAGMAAGLALSGLRPLLYSIANFPLMRCLEQIRNDIVYHHLPVTIAAVGGSFGYGAAGYSHHAVEDVSVCRAFAGLDILAPLDDLDARACTLEALATPGPVYLKLDKDSIAPVLPDASLGAAARRLRSGYHLTLVTHGPLCWEVLEAAQMLESQGVSAGVLAYRRLAPFDREPLRRGLRKSGAALVVEEQGAGALSSLVAEAIAEEMPGVRMKALRLRELSLLRAASKSELRRRHGLDAASIAASALAWHESLAPQRETTACV